MDRFLATELAGNVIVMRECLVEGNLAGDTLPAFYRTRANYLAATYGVTPDSYFDKVVGEFEKLHQAAGPSEFNLWFGYDLFCRANMWFVLALLQELPFSKEIFVVYPAYLTGNDVWQDFGKAGPKELLFCYTQRLQLGEKDLQLANDLWQAYKHGDLAELTRLSRQPSTGFPYLQEVCQAHRERFPSGEEKGRPEKVIERLLAGGKTSFPQVFEAFFKSEGVYGFGDLQVKRIYDKVMQSR